VASWWLSICFGEPPYREGASDLEEENLRLEAVERAFAFRLDHHPDLLEAVHTRFDLTHPLYQVGLCHVAALQLRQGRFPDALSTALCAAFSAAQENGHDHATFARVVPTLAYALLCVGRHAEAEALARRLVQDAAVSLSVDAPPRARRPIDRLVGRWHEDLNDDWLRHYAMDAPPPDQPFVEQAFGLVDEFLREPIDRVLVSRATRIEALHVLAWAVACQGSVKEAEATARQALVEAMLAFGPRHQALYPLLSQAADLLVMLRRFGDAARMFRALADVCASAYGARDADTVRAEVMLAGALATARSLEAEEACISARRALSRGALPPDEAANLAKLLDIEPSHPRR
jgi:hypothetical protein